MQIKDIVNRDIVNLTNCEQEPIHIPGSIQPHGFLLGVIPGSCIIDFCSGNIADFLNITHQQLLGKHFADVFGAPAQADMINLATLKEPTIGLLHLVNKAFNCTIHNNGTMIIVEAEPAADKKDLTDVYGQTRLFLQYMEVTRSLKELCQLVARGTREITGYDRVMIYRFDTEYNGEVIAESVRDDLEPFLGLHYPHTDIPRQARALYIQNLLRLIVDIEYTPVPLYTIDDTPGKNLDLSISILRSTSPIHVQYLHNMGVGATLTISLIYKGKLWGLIACHHYAPKNLTHEVRVAAKLQGHFITSQIDTRQMNEEYDIAKKCNDALEKVQGIVYEVSGDSFEKIIADNGLLDICNANGVAIYVNDRIYSNGEVPGAAVIIEIAKSLAESGDTEGFTSQLEMFLPTITGATEKAAGIIFQKIGPEDRDCIIWFRPQTLMEVNWAGDPEKAIIKNEQGLSPRNSFKLWKEVVKGKSNPWLQPELNAAANYAHGLEKHLTLVRISEEEKKYRDLSALLKQTNAELENINWISTHDLQEPLRKIQMLASRIMNTDDPRGSENIHEKIGKINHSASRMQMLLKDILKYTRIKHTSEEFSPVNPEMILEDLRPDFEDVLSRREGKIIIGDLPMINGNPFLLKQLFTNLIGNSLKFIAPEKSPEITINSGGSAQRYEGIKGLFHLIRFSDNGIGFEQEFAEQIFNVFTRLHNQSEYEGSGIGLALCKKIMQAHNGYINASGEPGKGATFNLYFPV